MTNLSSAFGSRIGIYVEAANPNGPDTAIAAYGEEKGLQVGVSSPTGYAIHASCSSPGSDTCVSVYSVNVTGSGPNAIAGYFSSPGTGVYTTTSVANGAALRAIGDVSGSFAAKISSTNGTALHVTAGQGQAAYLYASSTANATATVEQASYQPAIVAKNFSALGGDAIFAQAQTGDGVEARCTGSGCQNGVYGFSSNPGASCVIGQSSSTVQGYGVVGRSYGAGYGIYAELVSPSSGYAGYFQGRTHINGALSKLSGTFKIDHPQDPANKYLVHSFVESPEMKNVYDGVATLGPDGTATVRLPAYFESLNENFRYQLTPIGAPSSLYVKSEILAGAFVIAGGTSGLRVSWQVTGTRKDAWAKAHPVVVEEEKLGSDRGRYLTPELVGAGAAAIVGGPALAVPRGSETASPAPDFSRRFVAPPPN